MERSVSGVSGKHCPWLGRRQRTICQWRVEQRQRFPVGKRWKYVGGLTVLDRGLVNEENARANPGQSRWPGARLRRYSATTSTSTVWVTSACRWMPTSCSPTERMTPSGMRTSLLVTDNTASLSAWAMSAVPTEP